MTRKTLATAAPGGSGPAEPAAAPVTFAVLGDTPYGAAQREVFPALVDDINADPHVRFVLHAGDVKDGSSTCTTPASPTWRSCTAPSPTRSS
ncbi:MAG TPA: metallophosphoesterase [Micromonospora sp.]